MSELYSAMTNACRDLGIVPPDSLPAAGKWADADIGGDPHGKGDGRIKLFLDGEGGIVCNWKSDEKKTFFVGSYEALTPEQKSARHQAIEAARIRAEAEMKQEREKTAAKAVRIFDAGRDPKGHPYSVLKQIQANGARLHNDALVIPMRDGGEIHSLQFIGTDGDKRFLSGGRVAGCYFSIGSMNGATALCIAEGFATGATIHEATGHPVAVAFNAGNLLAVAKTMREKFPELPLILCADDDYLTEGNPGLTKATEAAQLVGGLLAVPDFGSNRPDRASDFNDMLLQCGAEAVKRAIQAATAPAGAMPQPSRETPLACGYGQVELLRGDTIQPESVNWIWVGWLAAGKFHVLGGAPGTGKTTITMSLAAVVTTGGRWPDGAKSPAGNVVIWSGEDDPADTLVPRLVLSGADLSRVYFINDVLDKDGRRSFDPASDMEPLQRKLEQIGDVRLLIVDPIVSAITGDSHKNAEVRRGLQPLVDLAASIQCALVGITHFSKGTGGRDPVERLTGSLAFGALARVVMVAAKHQEEGEDGHATRLFCRAKSNIGPDDGGFEYSLNQGELKTHPGVFASSVLWGDTVEGAARELLATADSSGDDSEGNTMADSKRFITDLLADGPMRAGDVFKDADGAGYSKRSIQRAGNSIGVIRHKDGMKGGWTWRLPPKVTTRYEGAVDAEQNYLASTAPSAASSLVEVEL